MMCIAPQVGGVKSSGGERTKADEKLDHAPSVLLDAVVLLVSDDGAERLANRPVARDIISDAIAHDKFIAYTAAAAPLLRQCGASLSAEEGYVPLKTGDDCRLFVRQCRELRCWDRDVGR